MPEAAFPQFSPFGIRLNVGNAVNLYTNPLMTVAERAFSDFKGMNGLVPLQIVWPEQLLMLSKP